MKFKYQCPQMKLHWNPAHVSMLAQAALLDSGRVEVTEIVAQVTLSIYYLALPRKGVLARRDFSSGSDTRRVTLSRFSSNRVVL